MSSLILFETGRPEDLRNFGSLEARKLEIVGIPSLARALVSSRTDHYRELLVLSIIALSI